MNDEEEIDPLLELFRTEVREHATALTRGLIDPSAYLDDLVHAVHTIRGASLILGFAPAASLAAALVDRFASAQAGRSMTARDVSECERAAALFAALVEAEPTEWATANAANIESIRNVLSGVATPAAPKPAPVPDVRVEPASSPVAAPVDTSILELFREEMRSHAETLSAGLLDLERDPANPQRIEPLMRAAHSMKGAARIVGLDPAVQLAHELESAFVAAGAGRIRIRPAEIDVFLRGTDLLAALSTEELPRWVATRGDEIGRLRIAVAAIVRGESAPAIEPTVVPDVIAAPPPPVEASPEPAEAVVRVTAQSLNRLMSLAGESLVQARWLQPFAASLLGLKKDQDRLATQLDRLAHQPTDEVLDVARQYAGRCRQVLAERIGEFEDHAGAAEDLNTRLYREVIVSRMRPFADGAHAFPRLVRDTARSLGKQARLDIVGATTEVDRDILEKLEAPLTHLLRNAVDHGLESTTARTVAGKSPEGVVRIEVRHRAGMLAITVGDDGAGIDVERLRAKVVERRHAPADIAARMSEAELLEFLFLPGFSTAGAVTEVSGRGVGLDVVLDTVRKVGGSVRIETKPSKGTAFHLLLPITLSVVRAVLVDIAGEPYAFPHNRIDRLLRVPRVAVRSLEHRQFIDVDGRNVGLVLAAQLLDLPAAAIGDDLAVLLLSDTSGTYGLIVEAFRGEQDLVVRPLDPRLGKVPNISAAAILDDGTPVLIADVEDLIRSMDQFIQSGTLQRCDRAISGPIAKKRVLVVDDSITVREMQRQILRTHGYEVEVAVDGQDGWNKVRTGDFDLVISDIDMPRMNGLEFVRRMREDQSLRDLPVVIVSYKDRAEDRLRGLEAGANHYLTKSSFHDHTFLDAVADLIGK